MFFSPLINFCMPWRNNQTFKFVLDAATGDTSQKHETVWDLDNRDCWGENRAGVTSRSRSERVRWGNWLWAFIVIRGWGQKKAWDCGLGLARFDCSTWTKRKSTQAYLATLLPCARHKGKREVCGFKTISNHTSKNETRLLIIHESILIHTNDEKQLNKWNEGEETNLCPQKTLKVELDPKYLDATDALAIALCHHYQMTNPLAGTGVKMDWGKFLADNPDRIKK